MIREIKIKTGGDRISSGNRDLFRRCRACGEFTDNGKDLRCKKCKEEIKNDFKGEGLKHGFDYYFRYYQKNRK